MAKNTEKQPRKRPTQARAQQTVAAILEAAAELLIDVGYDKLTTNAVATRAGVSVGSLYQYYPNKQALILSVAEQHVRDEIERFRGLSVELRKLPFAEANRQFVRALLQASAHKRELHKVLLTDVMHLGEALVKGLQQQAENAVYEALLRRREEILPKDLRLASFFLVSAVDAIVSRSATVANDRFSMEDLEQELCDLVERYLMGESSRH